jgi:hypothetical protein
VDTTVGDGLARIGVDVPAKFKLDFKIEASKANESITQIVETLARLWMAARKAGKTTVQLEALVRAWLAGEVELPEK